MIYQISFGDFFLPLFPLPVNPFLQSLFLSFFLSIILFRACPPPPKQGRADLLTEKRNDEDFYQLLH